MIESGSLTLVNALKEISPPFSAVATLEYYSLATSHEFRRVAFSQVERQGNRPTHFLAKHALRIVDFLVWIEVTSCFLEQALPHDVIIVTN